MNQQNNFVITELDKTKIYYITIPPIFDRDEWVTQAQTLKETFNNAGIQAIIGSFELDIKEVEQYTSTEKI